MLDEIACDTRLKAYADQLAAAAKVSNTDIGALWRQWWNDNESTAANLRNIDYWLAQSTRSTGMR
jgi:hypothetical protein